MDAAYLTTLVAGHRLEEDEALEVRAISPNRWCGGLSSWMVRAQ
jgi:hypothetical protein